jgi:hypothetical protein
MLRINPTGFYAISSKDGREAPIGLSIVREDGVRLVADLSIDEGIALAGALISAVADATASAAKIAAVQDASRTAQVKPHVLRKGSDMFHAMDCPGCEGTSFTASPRSETYWSS